jgi:hypothetical protein
MHQRTVRLIKEIRCQRMRLKLDTLSTGLKKNMDVARLSTTSWGILRSLARRNALVITSRRPPVGGFSSSCMLAQWSRVVVTVISGGML